MKSLLTSIGIGIVAGTFFFALSVSAQTSCLAYPSGSTPPSGYGSSWDVFSSARELLVKANCPSSGNVFTMTVGKGDPAQYVWNEAYAYEAGWVKKILSGTQNGGWIAGQGTIGMIAPLNTSAASPFYFVGYVCTDRSGTWKCGCENAACTTGKWQLQAYTGISGTVSGGSSVLSYGAKCNGFANDTKAFNDALKANTVVNIPAGRTCVIKDVVIPTGRTLQGEGANAIVMMPSNSNYMQVVLRIESDDVKIKNLIVDGNKSGQTVSDVGDGSIPEKFVTGVVENGGMHALRIADDSGNIELRNVTLRNAFTDGLLTDDRIHDLTMDNVVSDGNRRQGWSSCGLKNVTITNSRFSNTRGRAPGAGVDMECAHKADITNVRISNSRFIDNLGRGPGNGRGFVIDWNGGTVDGLTIENSTFTGNGYQSLAFVGRNGNDGKPTTFKNIAIRGNTMDKVLQISGSAAGSAIFSNVVIENNDLNGITYKDAEKSGVTERNNR